MVDGIVHRLLVKNAGYRIDVCAVFEGEVAKLARNLDVAVLRQHCVHEIKLGAGRD